MSNVKRYSFLDLTTDDLSTAPDTEYVEFADYERLRDALEWAELALEEIDEMSEVNEFGLRAVARMRLAEVRAKYALAPAAGSLEEADAPKAARKDKE